MNISIALMTLLTTGACENMDRCILDNVDITASLYHAGALSANLDYQEYILSQFNRQLLLEGASLREASFRRLQLEYINLKNANLINADLSDVIWNKADLSGASLVGARLNRAILKGANFENAYLLNADLLGADLSDSNFTDANLDGVDIRAANFTGANCQGAIFDSDGPRDPKFFGANFTDANLEGAEISLEAVYLCRTILPDGTISNRDCELIKKRNLIQ